jgi:HEAT repeat protein
MVHNTKLTQADMLADIKALTKFLKDRELPTRTHAARAIGTIASLGNPGPNIKEAVPALTEMLDDTEEHGQIAAIWALGRIGAPAQPAVKRLNEMLYDKHISEEGKGFVREAMKMIQGPGKN